MASTRWLRDPQSGQIFDVVIGSVQDQIATKKAFEEVPDPTEKPTAKATKKQAATANNEPA